MTHPIVLLTADELASHTNDHTYKWSKGARCGEWLVLIATDNEYDVRKPPVIGAPDWYEYGYKEYAGVDRGGLWFECGTLVDEDGCSDSDVDDRDDNGTVKLRTVGRMLEALGMDAKSFLV